MERMEALDSDSGARQRGSKSGNGKVGARRLGNCRVTKERAFDLFKGEMLTIRGSSPILGNCRDEMVCDLGWSVTI